MKQSPSFLSLLIQEYISYQKASDHWNKFYEINLWLFAKHCKRKYPNAMELSQEMVDEWCQKRETENNNNSCRSRIYVVVSFVRYLKKRGKTNIIAPIPPRRTPKISVPHSFTETELQNFFHACDSISDGRTICDRIRKITIPVFFRLLYSSGIRITEARMLRVEDVDLGNGILNIRYSKGHDQHYIVLHDSALNLLKRYDAAMQEMSPDRNYFFSAGKNKHHASNWVCRNFRKFWCKYNNSHAVAYDLRHNYAIENINKWVGEGFNFHARFFYLSRSMGHRTLESTKYYYSLVPGLSDIMEEKTKKSFNTIVPEVQDEKSV
jgi:integrase